MRRSHDPKARSLAGVQVFQGVTSRQLEKICELTTEVDLPAGRVLCRQGDPASEVFLLTHGEVSIVRDEVDLAVVGAGGMVGEMALQKRQPRSATAIALTDVTLQVLSTREFASLVATYPAIQANVRALVEARESEHLAA